MHYISQCGAGQTIERFLSYIDREVPFNRLAPDCIDRVIPPDVDSKILDAHQTAITDQNRSAIGF